MTLETMDFIGRFVDLGRMGWDGGRMWSPFMGLWMMGLWLIFLVIAYLVYKDAERRGMNGLLWAIGVLIPWAGVFFLLAYLVVRSRGPEASGAGVPRTAREILDERYARGIITREDYLRMKEDIEGPGQGSK